MIYEKSIKKEKEKKSTTHHSVIEHHVSTEFSFVLRFTVIVLQIYYQMFTLFSSSSLSLSSNIFPLISAFLFIFNQFFFSPPFLFSHSSSFPVCPPAMATCHPAVLLPLFVFLLPPPLPYFSPFLILLTCSPLCQPLFC